MTPAEARDAIRTTVGEQVEARWAAALGVAGLALDGASRSGDAITGTLAALGVAGCDITVSGSGTGATLDLVGPQVASTVPGWPQLVWSLRSAKLTAGGGAIIAQLDTWNQTVTLTLDGAEATPRWTMASAAATGATAAAALPDEKFVADVLALAGTGAPTGRRLRIDAGAPATGWIEIDAPGRWEPIAGKLAVDLAGVGVGARDDGLLAAELRASAVTFGGVAAAAARVAIGFGRDGLELDVELRPTATPSWSLRSLLGWIDTDLDPQAALDGFPPALVNGALDVAVSDIDLHLVPAFDEARLSVAATLLGFSGRLSVWTGRDGLGLALLPEARPLALADLFTTLGATLPEEVTRWLPRLSLTLGELRVDAGIGQVTLAGALASTDPAAPWTVDGRVVLRRGSEVWVDLATREEPLTFGALAATFGLPLDDLAAAFSQKVADAMNAVKVSRLGVVRRGTAMRLLVDAELGDLPVELRVESAPDGWSMEVCTFARLDAGALLDKLGVMRPKALPSLELDLQRVLIDLRAKRVLIDARLAVGHLEAMLRLEVSNDGDGTRVSPSVTVGDLVFEATFESGGTGSTFTATVRDTDGSLTLSRIARTFDLDLGTLPFELSLTEASFGWKSAGSGFAVSAIVAAPALGKGVTLQAVFASERVPLAAPKERVSVALVSVSGDLSAAKLPVVGSMVPKDAAVVRGLRVGMASRALTGDEAADLNKLLVGGAPQLPSEGLSGGAVLEAKLVAAGREWTLAQGVPTVTAPGAAPTATTATSAATGTAAAGGTPAPSTSAPKAPSGDGTRWVSVGRTLGPLRLDRIGLRYQDGALGILFDAALSFAGLTLSLDGLGITSPLTRFDPSFELAGLGLGMKAGPITIGGGFIQLKPPVGDFQGTIYAGQVTVGAQKLALNAVGAYAEIDTSDGRKPSVFLFLRVDTPLGGPPYFFVTGLAAGFGYNWKLRIPGEDEVTRFPLFPGASAPPASGPPTPNDALQAATSLVKPAARPAWLTPRLGEYWIAGGLSFTSFQLLETSALFVVTFGSRFELALLGVTSLTLPRTPPGAAPVAPLVDLRLGLRVYVSPDDGVVAASARIDPASYVLDPQCKLQGGFAFYTWFAGDHSGDFVVTLGGYHPKFKRPEHYPDEPRVGFSWQRTPQLSLKGSLYAALTPGAAMAGGSLSANFHDGDLRAWFNAWADFLVRWKPLRYEISVGVEVGASYRISVFGIGKTVSASLGADVQIWGPPFAGKARVKWWAISFTVRLGSGDGPPTDPLDWRAFAEAFLPQEADVVGRWVTARPAAGLLGTDHDVPAGGGAPVERWVVSTGELRIVTSTPIPATSLRVQGDHETGTELLTAPPALGVRPMARASLDARHVVIVEKWVEKDRRWEALSSGVRFTPVLDGVPTALWSPTAAPNSAAALPSAGTIPRVPLGVEISIPPLDPGTVKAAPPLVLADVAYGSEDAPLAVKAPPAEQIDPAPFGSDVAAAEGAIAGALASDEVSRRRAAFADALAGAGVDVPPLVPGTAPYRLRAPARRIDVRKTS